MMLGNMGFREPNLFSINVVDPVPIAAVITASALVIITCPTIETPLLLPSAIKKMMPKNIPTNDREKV
jgi:hypothetical protein